MKTESAPFYKKLGQTIKEARKVKGWGQQELADALDMSRAAVVNIEQGRQQISFYQYVVIADALDLSSPIEFKGTAADKSHSLRVIEAKAKELMKALRKFAPNE